jgi:glycine/D-amino acid oxidase-like deaminating enzyme
MISYWEQQNLIEYDHIIVGAGIVGLSTALELRQRFPKSKIAVLERGFYSSGASSRNAGFACMGSVTEILADLKTMSEEEVIVLFEKRKNGLQKLRARLGDIKIGYTENGSYEIISKNEIAAIDKIEYLNRLLLPVSKIPAFQLADKKEDNFGFNPKYAQHLIENTLEGELNAGKMMQALSDLCMDNRIEIKTGTEVTGFQEEENKVSINIRNFSNQEQITIYAQHCIFCTNAFSQQFFKDEEIKPGRGQVLITNPIPGLKWKGIFHFDQGYYYFREIDGRILFGGGRNLDFAGETTFEFGLNELIQNELENKLREIIIPNIPFTISNRWSGIMAFGPTKFPIVKAYSKRVFGAFRLGGMGVALGSEVAYEVADLVAQSK